MITLSKFIGILVFYQVFACFSAFSCGISFGTPEYGIFSLMAIIATAATLLVMWGEGL